MQRVLAILFVILLIGCGEKFEPELSGWRAYTHPARRVHVQIGEREKVITLPGDENVTYRYPQWTKDHSLLLVKLTTIGQCVDFQLVLADTTGSILDTVYTPPPRTPLNFKLAPNDSLLLLKTYDDDCTGAGANFKYTFYDRYLKTALPDTIKVRKARGLPLRENVWSPDSRKVIISQWAGRQVKASVYDVISKDTIYIDRGADFVWSPTDNEVVGYVKDYSVYTKNIVTGEEKVIFEGKKKREATDFRWSPDGETLMVHVRTYLLNIQSNMSQANHIIYVSMKDGRESRTYYDGQRIDTWIGPPGD